MNLHDESRAVSPTPTFHAPRPGTRGAPLHVLLAAMLVWLAPLDAAHAACSTHRSKVVFNEVYRPASGANSFVELKILNASVAAGTANFTGWKLDVYSVNVGTKTSADFHSVFINNALNTCGAGSLWIRVPDASIGNYLSTRALPYNFVLADSAGEIVDILRLGTSPASFYGAGSNYPGCSNIESLLPNTQYDATVSSSGASQKSWYRTPDGSGTWTGSSTANPFNTVCASNNGVSPPATTAFNCVEAGASAASGHIYTKLAGAPFSLDVVALTAANTVDTTYAGSGNRNVTVELVDGSGATACASRTPLSPAVAQTLTFTAANQGRKAAASMTSARAWPNVCCRVTDSSQPPSIIGCSSDNFAIRPGAVTLTTSANAAPPSASASPTVKAGSAFTLAATTASAPADAYTGTLTLDTTLLTAQTPLQAVTQQSGGVVGTLSPASLTANAAASNASYSEAGYLYLAPGAYRDDVYTAVDQPGDCLAGSLVDTLSGGQYGCAIGNKAAVAFGRFIPDHFETAVLPACGSFTYSGQPFPLTLTAKNLAGGITLNYATAYAKPATLSAANAVAGTFTPNPVAASAFVGGVADLTAPPSVRFAFASPLTAPAALVVRTTDSDGVSSSSGSPVVEGSLMLRAGRLRLLNTYGSELLPTRVPVRSEFYTGTGWSINSADNCTTFPTTAIAVTNVIGNAPVLAAATSNPLALVNGQATLVFNPTLAAGRFDLAIDLNTAGADTSCNTAHGGTAANLPWLQGFWSSTCGGIPAWAQDPNARIQLGAPKAPYIYLRERY
ncbi:MAG: hypothetical protein Q7S85_07715 [Rugosibacter sp.]|nr:hypothetical protein [Rugosibacter sp.]